MAVPTQLSDLSATAASNSPAGTDTVGTTMDDFLRAHASIIARISAGTDAMANPVVTTLNKLTLTQPATGATVTIANGKTLTVNGNTTLNTGISDTATATALTLSGSGANSVTIANSATNPTIGTSAGNLSLGSGNLVLVATGDIMTIAGSSTEAFRIDKTSTAMSTGGGDYPQMIDLRHMFAGGNPFGIAWRSSSRYDWIGQLKTSGDFAIVLATSGTPVNALKFNGASGEATIGVSLQVTTGFGCNSKTPQTAVTVNAASSDLSTVVALCNQLRAALVANGICV